MPWQPFFLFKVTDFKRFRFFHLSVIIYFLFHHLHSKPLALSPPLKRFGLRALYCPSLIWRCCVLSPSRLLTYFSPFCCLLPFSLNDSVFHTFSTFIRLSLRIGLVFLCAFRQIVSSVFVQLFSSYASTRLPFFFALFPVFFPSSPLFFFADRLFVPVRTQLTDLVFPVWPSVQLFSFFSLHRHFILSRFAWFPTVIWTAPSFLVRLSCIHYTQSQDFSLVFPGSLVRFHWVLSIVVFSCSLCSPRYLHPFQSLHPLNWRSPLLWSVSLWIIYLTFSWPIYVFFLFPSVRRFPFSKKALPVLSNTPVLSYLYFSGRCTTVVEGTPLFAFFAPWSPYSPFFVFFCQSWCFIASTLIIPCPPPRWKLAQQRLTSDSPNWLTHLISFLLLCLALHPSPLICCSFFSV